MYSKYIIGDTNVIKNKTNAIYIVTCQFYFLFLFPNYI